PEPEDGDWTLPCNRGFSQCGIPPCWIPPSFGFEKVFVSAGLRPCIAARPPMRERIWAASFAPPTGEKTGDFPPVFIQFHAPSAGHKKTPQVCVTHGVAPADGRSVFSYMVTGRRPRLTGTVPVSWHFVVFQRVKAHSTVVKS